MLSCIIEWLCVSFGCHLSELPPPVHPKDARGCAQIFLSFSSSEAIWGLEEALQGLPREPRHRQSGCRPPPQQGDLPPPQSATRQTPPGETRPARTTPSCRRQARPLPREVAGKREQAAALSQPRRRSTARTPTRSRRRQPTRATGLGVETQAGTRQQVQSHLSQPAAHLAVVGLVSLPSSEKNRKARSSNWQIIFFSLVLYLPSTNILIQETGDWAVGGWEEGLLLEHQERSQLDLHRIKISKTILGEPLQTPNTHSTILKEDTSDFETTTNTGHNSERVMLNQTLSKIWTTAITFINKEKETSSQHYWT